MFCVDKAWLTLNIFSQTKMHSKHADLNKLALGIRDALKIIYKAKTKTASSPYNCTVIRKLFKKFDKAYNIAYSVNVEKLDWLEEQQEPRDVFNMFLRVFDIKPDTVVTVNGRKDKHYFNSPFAEASRSKHNIRDYIPIHKNQISASKHSLTTYESAPIMCFNVERNMMNKKIKTVFEFGPNIRLRDGHNLNLVSIIIHHGSATINGHYTCILKQGNKWYHYDDMSSKVDEIGTINDVFKWNSGFVKENCTQLLYS